MATLQQLEAALVGAHRAGDLDAARKLAVAVKAARGDVGNQIPGAQVAATIPQAAGPGIMDRVIGAGEAALTTVTGATGGMLGMVGGTAGATAAAILDGSFGTPEAAAMIEQAAGKGAESLTYAPRTQEGQEQAGAVGQAMQQIIPAAAVLPGLGPAVAGLNRAGAAARTGAAAVLDKAATAVPAAMRETMAKVMPATPPVAPAAAGAMPATELAQTARRAGEGGMGSAKATAILAEQAAPDAVKVAAAERLGVREYLQPDHVTTSEAYRQVVATIKSNPQSAVALAEREGLGAIAKRADDLVAEIGGVRDLSSVDATVKARLQGTQAQLDGKAEVLYTQLREGVPARAQAAAPNVLAFIEQRAADLGGVENLSGMERMILRKLAPKDAPAESLPGATSGSASVVESLADFARRTPERGERLPPQVRPDFLGWLRRVGGVDFKHKYDITGERGGVTANPAGIFRQGGRGTDTLALLAEEEGYLRPGEGSNTRAFVDLVQEAVNGNQPLTLERQGAFAARDGAMRARDERFQTADRRLKALGVDTSPARGNPAILEGYLAKHEDALVRAAVDDSRQRGGASDMPQWQELAQRAEQTAADIRESARTLPQWESDVGPLSPVMRRMVADRLRAAGDDVPADAPATAAKRGPTYALLDDVRRDLTAAKYKKQGPFKDADTGLIKALEKRLMEDQRAAVEPYGMLDVFDAARTAVRMRKGIEDDLSALFGRDLDRSMVGGGEIGLPGAVSSLAKGDASKLIRLLARIPDDMRQQVVASGLSTVIRKASIRGEMDFTGFAKWYEGLRQNRQSYAAIMTNLPLESRKQLAALHRVSSGISESLNRRVKTGALNTIKAEMIGADSLMESLYSYGRRAAVAIPAEAAATSVGLPGAGLSAAIASALTRGKTKPMAAADALIASLEFEQMVRAAPGKQQAAAVRAFAYSPDFTRYLRAIGKAREITDRERWVLQAMRPLPAQQQPQQQRDTIH